MMKKAAYHTTNSNTCSYKILRGAKVFVTFVAFHALTIKVNIGCFDSRGCWFPVSLLQFAFIQPEHHGCVSVAVVPLRRRCRVMDHPPFDFGYLESDVFYQDQWGISVRLQYDIMCYKCHLYTVTVPFFQTFLYLKQYGLQIKKGMERDTVPMPPIEKRLLSIVLHVG